jgi:4-amino-4-deoxy-L-arabinose transferase-like glycosyltransferase
MSARWPVTERSEGCAWPLLLVVVLAGALRLVPIWFALDYPQARPDEPVAIGHAAAALEGTLNPQFFHWPSLTFYLFAGLFALVSAVRAVISGEAALTYAEQVGAARGLVALAGTATVVVLFRVGRRVADRTTGLAAAAFLAVAILHVRESHFAMTDVLMTFFVVTSLALLLAGLDAPLHRSVVPWFAAAGFAAGLATGTKYNAAAVGLAAAVAQIVLIARTRTVAPSAWLPLTAFGVLMAVGFVASTPYAVLDFRTFATDLQFNFAHLSEGHGIDVGRGWMYHLNRSLPYGTGVPVFVAGLAGVVPFVRHHRTSAAVLASFTAAFYLVIGSGYTVFFRYILPLVPLVCLSAAVAVRHAGPWLGRRFGVSSAAATWALLAVLAVPGLINCVWFDWLLAQTDTRVVATRWLEARLQPGDTLHDNGGDYTRLNVHVHYHPWRFDPETGSFGDPDGRTPDWLVLHQSPLRHYTRVPPALRRLAAERYELVHEVRATRGAAARAVYDVQDAFFLPVSRFDTVIRPGPTILIYRRRER